MTTLYTLEELANPMCPISSTASISFSIRGQKANSFSLPPYLFYAFKAKRLANLCILDESNVSDSLIAPINKAIFEDIREIAKSVHRDANNKNIDMKNYISVAIQSRLLFFILGENENDSESLNNEPAVPINASNSKKNVTVPHFLFKRLSDLLGGEKPAKLQIHSIVAGIKKEMNDRGGIDSSGKLIGDAANSSWSRKLHNKIFHELIKMSSLNVRKEKPLAFDIKMKREGRIETKVRSGKISIT